VIGKFEENARGTDLGGNLDRQSDCLTALERLFGSRLGANKPWLV